MAAGAGATGGRGKGCGRAPEDAQPEVTAINTPTPATAAARDCME